MPYITPASTPETTIRRCLFIPNDLLWLAAVNGALSELTKPYNWEDIDGITPLEAATRARQMFESFMAGECDMIGEIKAFATSAAVPANCLKFDGGSYQQSAFPLLWDKLPAAWKGATTFTLPNLIARSLIGYDPTPNQAYVVGTQGGEAQHTLTEAEIPAHDHPAPAGATHYANYVGTNGVATLPAGSDWTAYTDTGLAGGGAAHNNLPPYVVVVYAIVATL